MGKRLYFNGLLEERLPLGGVGSCLTLPIFIIGRNRIG
jgi:hypothetical protein